MSIEVNDSLIFDEAKYLFDSTLSIEVIPKLIKRKVIASSNFIEFFLMVTNLY